MFTHQLISTDTLQVIDDIEIPHATEKGFYLSYLDEERYILPGHDYVGMVGFNPKKSGLALDTIMLYIDSAAGTTPPFVIKLKGYAKGSTNVESKSGDDSLLIITTAPNPASDYIELYFSDGMIAKGTQISLINMTGQQIINERLMTDAEKYYIPLNSFDSGTYIVRMLSNGIVYSTKIIIIR